MSCDACITAMIVNSITMQNTYQKSLVWRVKQSLFFLYWKINAKYRPPNFYTYFLIFIHPIKLTFLYLRLGNICSRKKYIVIWIKLCSHFPFRFGTSLKVFILSLPFERRGWGCNGGQPLVNWVLTSLFFKHTSILK